MNWLDECALELERGREAERRRNLGQIRVCARRAAGIALAHFYNRSSPADPSGNAVALLVRTAAREDIPPDVRQSAARLAARVAADFTSPSLHPLDDAQIIVAYVRSVLER